MTIKDNGRHAPHRQQGIGRRTMSQRAEAVGGSVEVSTGEDGTAVILTIPLKKDK